MTDIAPLVFGYAWTGLEVLVAFAATVIFVCGLDDLFLDATYLVLPFLRRDWAPPQPALMRKPEIPIGVIIPAWQESDVIASMLLRFCGTQDYGAFHVFVGVYPNDPETQAEVRRVAERFPHVHCVVTARPGPTNKADCLNQVIGYIREFERQEGVDLGVLVFHDAEDVVHPLSLKLVSWYIDDADMLQLPVLSLDRKWSSFVACTYMDEFAEWHTKDLVVRSAFTGMVPSAGVATAIRRKMIDQLDDGAIFHPATLTEDYEIAHRIHAAKGKTMFVRYWARTPILDPANRRRPRLDQQLVSTREFFPDNYTASVRQKARWMLGISFIGWRNIGWYGSFWDRYFLMRDRKAILSAPTAMFAYLLLVIACVMWGLQWLWPQLGPTPTLEALGWVKWLILANFVFMLNRLAQRAWFVGRAHGVKHVWLSPMRAILGNFISFGAFWRATRMFLGIQLRSRPMRWDKTDHRYPSVSAVGRSRPSVADLLQHHGLVTRRDVARIEADMAQTGRPLGLQLLDSGLVSDAELASAYAELEGLPVVDADPFSPTGDLWRLLTPAEAARAGVLPLRRLDKHAVEIALSAPLDRPTQEWLERRLRRRGVKRTRYAFAPLSEVAFGIRYGRRDDAELEATRVCIERWLASGRLDPAAARALWREVQRRYVRLGDRLSRAGLVDQTGLDLALQRSWKRREPLADSLRTLRIVPPSTLREQLARQDAWWPDLSQLAFQVSFVNQPGP